MKLWGTDSGPRQRDATQCKTIVTAETISAEQHRILLDGPWTAGISFEETGAGHAGFRRSAGYLDGVLQRAKVVPVRELDHGELVLLLQILDPLSSAAAAAAATRDDLSRRTPTYSGYSAE